MNQARRGSAEFEDARRPAAEFDNRARKLLRVGGCLAGAATQAVGDLWGQPYKSEFSTINTVRRLAGFLF